MWLGRVLPGATTHTSAATLACLPAVHAPYNSKGEEVLDPGDECFYYGNLALPALQICVAQCSRIRLIVTDHNARTPTACRSTHPPTPSFPFTPSSLVPWSPADTIHPSGKTGHRALTDLIVGMLQEAVTGLARAPLSGEDEAAAQV